MKNKKKKILLTGGGTAGSVSPLLAVFELIKNEKLKIKNYQFLWIGTNAGPERQMVEKEGIEFRTICNGKLRRYFSWQNFIDPFKILVGYFQSILIITKWKPDLVMSAGGFVSVPVVWAAWVLRVPVLIHQQDVRPGLANKLMAPFAKKITVTFEKSLVDYGEKAVWTGNLIRQSLIENRKQKTENSFIFDNNLPIVLVVGGGTGAEFFNEMVLNTATELTKFCNLFLITGKGKDVDKKIRNSKFEIRNFLDVDKMAEALNVADVVVSRAGLNLSTEISLLGKAAIIIPIPDSHQEDNARIFKEQDAAIVLNQKEVDIEIFVNNIRKLIKDDELRARIKNNAKKVIKLGNQEVIKVIQDVLDK